MPPYELIDEYESGWKAVRGPSEFFVETPTDSEIEFGSAGIAFNRRRTRLFAALCVRFGDLPKHDHPEAVPARVATVGKAEIAAYLWAVHYHDYKSDDNYRPDRISTVLDVNEETVTKYCRRVIRSVENKKTGGTGR
jgi:hypothetical protein